jgi:hypothetical protein
MFNVVAVLIVILLILTKIYDCISTLKVVKTPSDEKNPFARWFMKRIGIKNTVWFFFFITVVISISAGFVAFYLGDKGKAVFILFGLFVLIVQYYVGRFNSTGKRTFWVLVAEKIVAIMKKLASK